MLRFKYVIFLVNKVLLNWIFNYLTAFRRFAKLSTTFAFLLGFFFQMSSSYCKFDVISNKTLRHSETVGLSTQWSRLMPTILQLTVNHVYLTVNHDSLDTYVLQSMYYKLCNTYCLDFQKCHICLHLYQFLGFHHALASFCLF